MPEPSTAETAGASAARQADLFAESAGQVQAQVRGLLDALRQLRRQEGAYRVGAAGERQAEQHVQRVLVDLGRSDWHLLADRRWPGTRRANIDLILVGPPGVCVLEVKTWRDVRITTGSLWRGQERADDALDEVRAQAEALGQRLAGTGLAPTAVHALLVLTGRRDPGLVLSGVTVVGEQALQRELARLGARLTGDQVARVLVELDEACPPASRPWARRRRPRPAAPAGQAVPDGALLTVDEVLAGAREAAERGPIESWMVWLHPAQGQLTARSYVGPARLRGPAGTGKTVVALHRAVQLARRPGARVLVTSYVRTLPAVHAALFARLAPELGRFVEFRGLHSWAGALLGSRGDTFHVDVRHVQFEAAWQAVGRPGPLGGTSRPSQYWRDEISAVVKGRGLTAVDEYLVLDRVGRRTALREEQRRAVWALYEEYQRRLRRAGQCDWDDILLRALDSVRQEPVDPPYTAVIVDEVQDLTCTGMRLLHALVGDTPDGLFLVGDGQQSVYPGGFTLAEAGVNVAGRATVLTRNYRNAGAVLRHALDVVGDDRFDDLGPEPEPGTREVDVERPGGQVARVLSSDQRSQQAALVYALCWTRDHGTRTGDMAVLVASNAAAHHWRSVLLAAGVPATLLTDYEGHTDAAVKVGTYHRAKGLEFSCVFLPDHDRAVPAQGPDETDDAYRDRAELQRRRLFVAMTRARDRLWLGAVQ